MALLRNTSPCLFLLLAAALAIPSVTTRAADAVRGVTDTEIIIGTMTDLSGVTAVQAVNNVNAVRMAFDEANAKGGVHGRKIKYIVEDMQYQVPKAVQAMNKLLNRDNIFFALVNGGTPMNDAVMPMMLEKNVPNVFPLTAARSMYEPFNKFKFGQFASYYDEMRSGVKYFVQQKGRKAICAMYQDSDFGRDVFAGAEAEAQALGLQIVAQTAHAPTDTDFTAAVTKLREAHCDMVVLGTIVRDTIIILQTAHKQGWNPDFVGQVATYSTAIAEAPGNPAQGFYAMTPALYAYPDDPRPEVNAFAVKYKARYGFDVNFLGETGYTAAQFVLAVLEKAGRDLSVRPRTN
jgi:branched-chain amino acid transport system substrate-binding protein